MSEVSHWFLRAARDLRTQPQRMSTSAPKTDAEHQASRRKRRKEEMTTLREALIAVAQAKTIAEARSIAIKALTRGGEGR